MNSTSTQTLRSGVKPVREYKKRSKKIKLVLEESIAEPEPVFDVPEPETEPLNKSNTSLEIFGPAEDEDENDSNDENFDDFGDEDEKDDDDNKELELDEQTDDEEDINVNAMNENRNEEEEGKKRKKCQFIPIKKYKTEAEADFFIRSSHPRSIWKIKYNHLTLCTLDQAETQISTK